MVTIVTLPLFWIFALFLGERAGAIGTFLQTYEERSGLSRLKRTYHAPMTTEGGPLLPGVIK
jgi:hypothetical protein